METKKQKLKELRRLFREQVLKRDNNQCAFCDCKEDLDAHHITNRNYMPMYGYVISNGITLCNAHHALAEHYSRAILKESMEEFSPENLYKIIDSSYDKALSDCVKLEEGIIG